MNRSRINKITVLIPKLTYFIKRNFRIIKLKVFKIWAGFSKIMELTPREEEFEQCIKTVMSRLGVDFSKKRGSRDTRKVNDSKRLVSRK